LRFLLTAFIAGESLLLFLPQLPNESLWFWLLTSLGFCLLLIALFSLIKRQALNKISFCILLYILFALGFIWSGYLTHERIKNDLPQNLEGVPLLVEGVVDGLPSQGTQSLRFSMTVESVLSDDELIQIDLQYFPKRLSLGWYPGWRGETPRERFRPEQQHVHAAVGFAVVAQRPRDAPSRVAGAPWLDPGPDTLFEIRDDAIGDARVHVGA